MKETKNIKRKRPVHRLPRDRARELLYPFARKFNALLLPLYKLSLSQMRELRAACDWPTKTNCWSAEYGVAPILREWLDQWIACEEKRAERLS